MTIDSDREEWTGMWSQVVVCKPGEHYRIEATLTADLTVARDMDSGDAAGAVLSVLPIVDDLASQLAGPAGERMVTPGVHRSSRPLAIRTYYHVPKGVRRLRIFVGLVDARGSASIHQVRFIEILEPEETSHPLAIPAPPHTLPAPRVVKSVCVCSSTADERPITHLLAGYFGERHVRTAAPKELRRRSTGTDALLLPDAQPPPAIRSLSALMELAEHQIVVVALPAFAKLSNAALSLRRVKQDDDPICAQVAYANFATRGFALHDVFAYAWPGDRPGSFVQNHFRRTAELEKFCDRRGFVTLLRSMCDQDVTSERPVCLYKETSGGGLFVLDIEPAEAEASTFGERALAMYLLLSFLGQPRHGLGEYVVPVAKGWEFHDLMRGMDDRFGPFVVHDSGLPIEEVSEQYVTVGWEYETFGLPLTPQPCIVIRSGLNGGDVESVYGVFAWFKQFVRPEPHHCPYREQLASQFRLAWAPRMAPWGMRSGWRRNGLPAGKTTAPVPQDVRVALLIDVASSPVSAVRVMVPGRDGAYRKFATWLPQLAAAFGPGRYFTPDVEDGGTFRDYDRIAWRHVKHDVELSVNLEAFQSDLHCDVIAGGGQVVRIEVPGNDADFTAHSIQRTDLTATLLEHVIGLQYGLIAVNRTRAVVHLDGFSPVAPGEALIVDHRDPMLREDASQAG
jgi:hypothetical protein